MLGHVNLKKINPINFKKFHLLETYFTRCEHLKKLLAFPNIYLNTHYTCDLSMSNDNNKEHTYID